MSSRTAEAAPINFGREKPCEFSSFDEFLAADYAPDPCRVIQLGCGDGQIAVYLARKGYEVLGIEADRDLLASARERAHMAKVGIDLMGGDPLLLPPLPEESFGVAVDLSTAAGLPDGTEREEFLRRLFRLLRRNGVLIASAPAPKRRRRQSPAPTRPPYAFAGPFVSDFTRSGFEVLREGLGPGPTGEQRLMVHARKPG